MAIHEVPGYEATVIVDGETAKEYDVPAKTRNDRQYQEPHTITKYVESFSDKPFEVQVKMKGDNIRSAPKGWNLTFKVLVDGKHIREVAFAKTELGEREKEKGYEETVRGPYEYSGEYTGWRTMRFAKINTKSPPKTTRTSTVQQWREKLAGVGEITVKFYYRAVYVDRPTGIFLANYDEQVPGACVGEKFPTHGTVLDKPDRLSSDMTVATSRSSNVLRGEDYPLAVFKFLYRSRETLEHLGIISPPIDVEPDILKNLTVEQQEKIKEIVKEMQLSNGSSSSAPCAAPELQQRPKSNTSKRKISKTPTTLNPKKRKRDGARKG